VALERAGQPSQSPHEVSVPAVNMRNALIAAHNKGMSNICIQDVLSNTTNVHIECITDDAISCVTEHGKVRLIHFHAIVWIEWIA
jgi:hypothetical protein